MNDTTGGRVSGRHAGRSLEQRLTTYALAGGAVLAAADRAGADVIMTTPPHPIPINATNTFAELDLNNDGTPDVLIGYAVNGSTATLLAEPATGGQHFGVVGMKVAGPFIGQANALTGCPLIGPASSFTKTPFDILAKANLPNGPATGPFAGAQGAFLGVEFNFPTDPPGSPPHYGWVQLDVSATDATASILGWGVDTVAGEAVMPCTTAVPEPTSLALLALGSVGVLAWRRHRKSRAA